MKDEVIASELLKLAKAIAMAADPADGSNEVDVEDPKFTEKIHTLKAGLLKIAAKKRRRLQQYGIAIIRPTDTVEDLVDALLKTLV